MPEISETNRVSSSGGGKQMVYLSHSSGTVVVGANKKRQGVVLWGWVRRLIDPIY